MFGALTKKKISEFKNYVIRTFTYANFTDVTAVTKKNVTADAHIEILYNLHNIELRHEFNLSLT
jgi:hypothetical protein